MKMDNTDDDDTMKIMYWKYHKIYIIHIKRVYII